MATDQLIDRFIGKHRWATLTVLRKSGSPVSSIVAYAVDGDALVVSTPGSTFKRRAMEVDARVNLCIMSNEEPFDFVSLEATGEVLTENIAEATKKVFKNIEAVGYTLPDPLDDWLTQQSRVILRLTVHRRHAVLRWFEE